MTNVTKKLFCGALALLAILGAGVAVAGGSNVHFGFAFGGPAFWPGYYSYPWPAAPYYPATVAAPPVSYVEITPVQSSTPNEHWWYYCAPTKTYYPYVKECATGWERVAPRPPS